ncbi:large conductance mechanosensitive channel protein MscL [Salinibacterium sp. ZJ450]|uniref:large conductance mechanosensitive channel protein MscL n=1 Tax=Salinibacterium sp. ZJ450 TaxID=2708338 RepID=UPI001CD3D4BB|nr:large conductance mechanosensitive channel protein MscL [Salinibacterium sp. ZJ450]
MAPETKGYTVLKGFRDFITRGNVIDLAVAVVIGTAFTAIVNTLVASLFNPLIGALFNAESLSQTGIVTIPTLGGAGTAELGFGAVLAAVIQFLLVALVVYFVFVFPMNKFREHAAARRSAQTGAPVEESAPTETELLAEIRDILAQVQTDRGRHSELSDGVPAARDHA